jgi:predicted O-methyltransferase YrrM
MSADHDATRMTRRALIRAHQTARAVAAAFQAPPYVKPGHYYSPLTGRDDIRRALSWPDVPGVTLNEVAQLELAAAAESVLASRAPGPRYREGDGNEMFGAADAAVYRVMLGALRPSRIIEAGSGFSTAVALDEAAADPRLTGLEMTCIEPYPARLRRLLRPGDAVTVVEQPVQDVPLETFERLGAGDILFIDSSHVAKAGSDVTWLLLHVLPRLAAGVAVHVHDIFWPFTYPAHWLAERRDWNEAYFLHAFLAGHDSWEILLFASWLWQLHPEVVPARLADDQPGSLWLRKKD